MSHDLARPLESRAIRLYKQGPLKVSHNPARFGGYKHCGSGDIIGFFVT